MRVTESMDTREARESPSLFFYCIHKIMNSVEWLILCVIYILSVSELVMVMVGTQATWLATQHKQLSNLLNIEGQKFISMSNKIFWSHISSSGSR